MLDEVRNTLRRCDITLSAFVKESVREWSDVIIPMPISVLTSKLLLWTLQTLAKQKEGSKKATANILIDRNNLLKHLWCSFYILPYTKDKTHNECEIHDGPLPFNTMISVFSAEFVIWERGTMYEKYTQVIPTLRRRNVTINYWWWYTCSLVSGLWHIRILKRREKSFCLCLKCLLFVGSSHNARIHLIGLFKVDQKEPDWYISGYKSKYIYIDRFTLPWTLMMCSFCELVSFNV